VIIYRIEWSAQRRFDLAGKTKTVVDEKKEREEKLNLAVTAIERQFGKGSMMRLNKGAVLDSVPVIPTGSLALDIATGIGGYPKGRIVEVYGQESSGKTTLALLAIAQVQKQGGVAVFIDAEHALDIQYARKLGVNIEELLISQPDYGEQALEIAETLVRTDQIDLVVVDSVAALVPKAELEGAMGDSHVGLQARLMSQALRKLAGILSKSKTCMYFINQIRMKIGVMYGNPETTTGGNALKFYATQRLEVRKNTKTDLGDRAGAHIKIKVVKNKMAPPFKVAEFDLVFGEGIDKTGELLDLAVKAEIVKRSGSWYSYNDKKLGQGREQTGLTLKENPEMLAEIDKKVRNTAFGVQEEPAKKSEAKESENG